MRAHHAWPAPATPSGACRPQRSLALRSLAIFGGSLMRQSSEVRVHAPIMEFAKSGSSAGTFTVVLIHRRGQIRRCGRCFWSRGYSFDKRMWLRLRQVRYGSNSEVGPLYRNVRSTLNSRRRRPAPACPKGANKRLMHRSKRHLYSITLSARPSSEGGTARPSALAVLRLTISSDFVGCLHPSGFALRKPPTTGSR